VHQRLQANGCDSVRIPRHDKGGSKNEDGAEYVVYDPQQVSARCVMLQRRWKAQAK
jgi:hypothetical protein